MNDDVSPFAQWLHTTMQNRNLSQAAMARTLGVADAQVSRWRRGQVVPTVHTLQQIADAFGIPRTTLDRLAGYPVTELEQGGPAPLDPEAEAELQAYQARYGQLMAERVPRALWKAYAAACEALAEALAESFSDLPAAGPPSGAPHGKDGRNIGFRYRNSKDE
jgi:transcriptional regulator with XRE-family HTH domain